MTRAAFDDRLSALTGSLATAAHDGRVASGPGDPCHAPARTVRAERPEADGARSVFGTRAASRHSGRR